DEQPLRIAHLRPGRTEGVAGPERLFLHGDVLALEGVHRVGRDDEHERISSERLHGRDDPVDEPAPEQRVQVLRRGGLPPRAEPRGHDHGSEVSHLSWGARIRTWDRGTKTRCLTSWLRPIKSKGKS